MVYCATLEQFKKTEIEVVDLELKVSKIGHEREKLQKKIDFLKVELERSTVHLRKKKDFVSNWSKSKVFQWAINVSAVIREVPVKFLPNPKADGKISGLRLISNRGCEDDPIFLLLDEEIISGIYKIVFKSESEENLRYFGLVGAAQKHQLSDSEDGLIWGSCQIGSDGIYLGKGHILRKEMYPLKGEVTIALELCLVNDNQREAGKGGGTLHFFVNETQIAYAVTGIPPHVHFFIDAASDGVGEMVSFQQLSATTADRTVQCKEYEWK